MPLQALEFFAGDKKATKRSTPWWFDANPRVLLLTLPLASLIWYFRWAWRLFAADSDRLFREEASFWRFLAVMSRDTLIAIVPLAGIAVVCLFIIFVFLLFQAPSALP